MNQQEQQKSSEEAEEPEKQNQIAQVEPDLQFEEDPLAGRSQEDKRTIIDVRDILNGTKNNIITQEDKSKESFDKLLKDMPSYDWYN
ncbi:hypothetical protein [Sharpea azabuensis]|uniref:hypothetical protein n=1 Tax=Sharpea azabuensis TaxID=322505 RepID=UPI001569DAD9|nr:hypothetical protein [Sharpea azabuensis]